MDNQKRKWTGYFIPAELWEKDLSIMEMLLIVEISSYDQKVGCFKSNKSLAERLKMSERNVSRLISSLNKEKHISVQLIYKENSKQVEKRILRSLWTYRQNVHPLTTEMSTPSRQDCLYPHDKSGEDSNTLNSNTDKSINVELEDSKKVSPSNTNPNDGVTKEDSDQANDQASGQPTDQQKFIAYIEMCNEYLSKDGGKTLRGFRPIEVVKSKFLARLKEGYTGKDFAKAMTNAMASDYHRESSYGYLTPEFFSRADKLEQWLNREPVDSKPSRPMSRDEIAFARNIPYV